MSLGKWAIAAIAWTTALVGGLHFHKIEMGHSICGPWGCGPPTSALIGMHIFWLAIIAPLGLLASQLPHPDWRRFGWGLAAAALVMTLGMGIYDYFSWQREPLAPTYVFQRFFFRIATLIDIPILQIGLTGILIAKFGNSTPAPSFTAETTEAEIASPSSNHLS